MRSDEGGQVAARGPAAEKGPATAGHAGRGPDDPLFDRRPEPARERVGARGKGAVGQLEGGQERGPVHHARKYSWVIGRVSAAGTVASSPSRRTSYVSGSTVIAGVAEL